ncbi:MAG: arsenate reductase-like glutaredoxin family protein [Olleya marilimosa]|jgi:arsenate reductase-like glutaredoxin family protein|uniref:arsenate reductase family protein n=1 Tax=Olleya marilimosa TaxID=272164 RepID=UPI0030EC3F40|tara:strand:+ start:156285 stop:156668 length:384 start_codon:yes stop_codon:yes gene_type:complete
MGVIATDSNKITFYYNSNSNVDKQTLAYVQDSLKKILTIDVSKTKVSDTQWAEIATKLNLTLADLVNKNHPDFTKNYNSDTILSEDDWIKVIQNNPDVIANAILVIEDKFYKIETPSQVRQLLGTNS